MNDYHSTLGVENNATADEIKEAYRKLAKKFHPDLNGGDQFFVSHFRKIQEAYDALTTSSSINNASPAKNKAQANASAEDEFEKKIFAYKKQNEMFRAQQQIFETHTSSKSSVATLQPLQWISFYFFGFVVIAFFVILILNPKVAVGDAFALIIKIILDGASISLPITALLIGAFLLYRKLNSAKNLKK